MIFLTGDTHYLNQQRVYDLIKKVTEKKYLERPKGTDYLIVLGDCALGWVPQEANGNIAQLQIMLKRYLMNTGRTLEFLFVAGNHENYDYLNGLRKVDRHGAEVRMLDHGIYNLITGNVYTIEKSTFAVYGGGLSIDKEYRTEGVSWWADEIPSKQTADDFFETVENLTEPVYLLTHTTSSAEIVEFDMYPFSGKLTDPVAEYLRIIKKIFPDKFIHHYFGHFHIDKQVEEIRSTCLSAKIIELGEKF